MHKIARQIFVDEPAYRQHVMETNEKAPYCERCQHRDQKADIDTKVTVRRLLHDVDLYELLDGHCKDALTDW